VTAAAGLVDVREIRRAAMVAGLRPPPRLSLSEWADEHFRLSAESAATAGRWSTLPYQRGIMDAITDPTVTEISLMKSARVGYTLMVSAAVGYYMHQAPAPILLVQPTVEDAEGFSKETIAPMLRDVPVLSKIIFEDVQDKGPKGTGNTISHKHFPGGVLSLVGANSGTGFRRVSRKVIIFDEVDAYPPSAGNDGDPIELGIKRSEFYWDRKIIAGSTPLIAGLSRIEQRFNEGDQRRFYVPCPHCEHMDYLVFTKRETGGHWLYFDPEDTSGAHFVCSANGCVIEHSSKRDMIERGEWRASKPFRGHASFHIWAAYSYSPNATWSDIAERFLKAQRNGPEKLRVFVNTELGETWREAGEAPDWERLHHRRERYPTSIAPVGAKLITCGVDVQKDRWIYEVVAWGNGKESWSIDIGVIPGDTGNDDEWKAIDELISRVYPSASSELELPIAMTAIDSGYRTSTVYNYVRRKSARRVMAIKGVANAATILGIPKAVDVLHNGKRYPRGCRVWPVGSSMAKDELYGWLRLERPKNGEPYPPGFCHFPEHPEEFFKQLTAEQLVTERNRQGFTVHEWQMIPGRENHHLDTRVYARAAASVKGLERPAMRARPLTQTQVKAHLAKAPQPPPPEHPKTAELSTPVQGPAAPPPPKPKRQTPDVRFTFGRRFGKAGSWFGKRR
jgi:phage terminase large subunit GpA-like protein